MFFIAMCVEGVYNKIVMERNTRFYVSKKNILTWLMTLSMICSAVARIWFVGEKGADPWSQIVLPIAAVVLYALTTLFRGKEQFYKTAFPVWLNSIYYGLLFWQMDFGKYDVMIGVLYIIVMLFIAVMYTQITSGKRTMIGLLIPLHLFPVAAVCYVNRTSLLAGDYLWLLPDALAAFGLVIIVFAIRVHADGKYHPTWGDRTDGRRIRTEPAMNQVSPYIMVTRNTSANLFSEAFEISNVERYVRKKRKEGLTNFGLMHVMLAAYCRAMCRYPRLNRFIAGQKIYSRGNDIQFCLTIKKELTADSPETVIKVHLTPEDTAEDVYNKINAEVEKAKDTPLDSGMDNTAALLTLIPGVLLKFVVWLLKLLDYFGLLPKFLLEVSPFHGSVFFTSMGSLGIPPIYHHLYDFGNLPVFGSFGCKRRALEVQEDGTVVQKKYIDVKFTLDERIVDGYYYAAFFKHYRNLLRHPELLDMAPPEIISDIE